MPINSLKIRAILLALRAFHHLLAASHIRIQSDNAMAVAYVNHQGGTRSTQAMREVSHILHWVEDTGSVLSAVHILGVDNWEADFPRRQGIDLGEWSLHAEIFCQICHRWGTPDVDLMASHFNAKVSNVMARTHNPRSLGADVLVQERIQFQLLYIFPPLPLISRVAAARVCQLPKLSLSGGSNPPYKRPTALRILLFQPTPEWLDSDSCQKCDQPFFWNFKQMWDSKKIGLRQHHCRKCGKAVCGKCSSKRSTIPLMGFEFDVRVCDGCYESITDEQRAPTATFHNSKHNIVHVHFDPTRVWLLTSGTDKVIKLWDMTPVVS
ncbi:unnamed protein product [Ranitomeya imitator]|uniref:FYVE-type domain-containing protein n=1 Tax=Ranitomeya imitator TaxID=111125 RepID=A0ABN9KNZ2_9NEOB|nr:unnamed protein product [Ranitomeya imitator]